MKNIQNIMDETCVIRDLYIGRCPEYQREQIIVLFDLLQMNLSDLSFWEFGLLGPLNWSIPQGSTPEEHSHFLVGKKLCYLSWGVSLSICHHILKDAYNNTPCFAGFLKEVRVYIWPIDDIPRRNQHMLHSTSHNH